MRAGEDFSFRAIVYDASGCLLYVRPTWAIDGEADHADLSPAGAVHIHPDAPEGEVRLNASVGGRSALVTIEIASSERYDGLLKSGAFNADGEVDEAATVAIASQSIGAASAVAEDTASRRKKLFVWLVGAVALLLGVGSALLYPEQPPSGARSGGRGRSASRRTTAGRTTAPTGPPEVVVHRRHRSAR